MTSSPFGTMILILSPTAAADTSAFAVTMQSDSGFSRGPVGGCLTVSCERFSRSRPSVLVSVVVTKSYSGSAATPSQSAC